MTLHNTTMIARDPGLTTPPTGISSVPVAAPIAPPIAPPAPDPTPKRSEIVAGQRLGDYRLEACIGRGASASVWRAVDVRLHMPIALKLFTPQGRAGRALLRGVMREARAASRVVSDHVIRVKDAGWIDDQALGFIAMELCADYPDARQVPDGEEPRLTVGHTLEQRLPETLEACVRAVQQAALGVADAHREGVFHRDVKPANILIRPGSGRAQITDFGLTVADLGTPSRGSVRIPVAGSGRRVIQGTPDYMPPEAAHGLPIDLDPAHDRVLLSALDVYGLGATLYALLSGRPPFRSRPDAEDPIADLLDQVREDLPTPLTEAGRFRIPDSLRRIVEKSMHPMPDERYASARALAEDLDAWLADFPTTLDGTFPIHRARLYARRNRAPLGAVLSVMVMTAAVATTAWVSYELDQRVQAAEAQVLDADAKRQAATGLAEAWESQAAAAAKTAKDAERAKAAALERAAISQSDRDAARKRALALLVERDGAQALVAEAEARSLSVATQRDEALQRAAIAEAASEEARIATQRIQAERDAAEQRESRARKTAEQALGELTKAQAAVSAAERRASTAEALRVASDQHAEDLRRRLDETRRALVATQMQKLSAPTPE